MQKKINNVLNIIMGSFAGVFLGRVIYGYWRHKTHPGSYSAIYPAPWYKGILVYGVVALAGIAVCLLIKGILKFHGRKSR